VEKAMNISPLKWEHMDPVRAMPRDTLLVIAFNCNGSNGASVATTAMMDPDPSVGMAAITGSEEYKDAMGLSS
jgi:hypothetical protein